MRPFETVWAGPKKSSIYFAKNVDCDRTPYEQEILKEVEWNDTTTFDFSDCETMCHMWVRFITVLVITNPNKIRLWNIGKEIKETADYLGHGKYWRDSNEPRRLCNSG